MQLNIRSLEIWLASFLLVAVCLLMVGGKSLFVPILIAGGVTLLVTLVRAGSKKRF